MILSQNLERPSRIVATEIFFLKWLRSCSNFVRGISVMKLSEKLHTTMGLKCTIRHLSKPTAVEAVTAAEAATAADDRSFSPKPSSTSQRCNELGTEISMSPNMFERPSCVPFSGQSHLNIFSCPLLLVGLSQNSDRASRIVATEIFFLKWLRSG